MEHYMIINDFNTTSISDCYVLDFGQVQTAKARKVENSYIYGANGSHTVLDGAYESYSRTLILRVKRLEDIQTIINHLKEKENQLVFGYQVDSLFYADLDEATYEPWGQHAWKLTLKLEMHPFRYLRNVQEVVVRSPGSITNPGNVYSEPIITIEGNGAIQITIDNQTMKLDIQNKAIIDCRHRRQNIYDANKQLKNTFFKDGDFFELKPGISGVVTKGNVSKISIQGNWRYLA